MKNLNELQSLLESRCDYRIDITTNLLKGIQVLKNAKKLVVLNEEINILEELIADSPTKSKLISIKERKLKYILDTDVVGEEQLLQYKAEVNLINWILS